MIKEIEKLDLMERFREYIKKESLIQTNDSLLLGVSGGPDSLTMLDLFYRLQDELSLQLEVFHLNHMFREEATQEAQFVRAICRELDIKCWLEKFDVPALIQEQGLSPEEGARCIRMQLLLEKAKTGDIDKIALGHNLDDQVETVLLNLCRGTGLQGLTGIDPLVERNDIKIIHPLLSIYRYEIEEYCRDRDLKPRRDSSNESLIYTRNKIRHKIIPCIEDEINSGFKEVVARMTGIIREENNFLDNLAEQAAKGAFLTRTRGQIILSLNELKAMDRVLRRRVLQDFIYQLKTEAIDLYAVHFQALEDLIFRSKTGKKIDLPSGIMVIRDYGKLIIAGEDYKSADRIEDYQLILEVPGEVELPGKQRLIATIIDKRQNWMELARQKNICLCDYDSVEGPLTIRNRRDGDSFRPLGLGGSKKLKDFFIDEKVSRPKREITPLILDNRGCIIWVAGFRMDERFRVRPKTEKIVKLILKKREGDNDE